MRLSIAALVLLLAASAWAAGPATVAATPPMGWNSWDCYGTAVTEAQVKANADYMAKHLKQHGWQYVVVDIQWSEPHAQAHGYRPDAALAMDEYGRLIPAVNRFPSSAGGQGFKPLADYVHSLGLRFGIHIMRGIPRRAAKANLPVFGSKVRAGAIADPYSLCPWNSDMYGVDMSRAGAQDYYDSILKMYAGWGVDYIKADDIARPAHREEIAALHRAILKTGRPIVLSLSPGPAMVKDAAFLQRERQHVAHLRRFLGRLEAAAPELHPDVDLERHGTARRVARCRHAAAGPHRHQRGARRGPHDPLHARGTAHADEPVVDRAIAPDVRRRPAEQRRLHALAHQQRRGSGCRSAGRARPRVCRGRRRAWSGPRTRWIRTRST